MPNSKFPTIFISWLNLEIGFDTCFFEGLDTYWKMWLQLAFPTYVIVLVAVVIVISNRSIRFSQLIGRKNPVATLATLVLLSYTTFLKTITETLSYSTLNYPDGSQQTAWLPDATVPYLSGKHAVLFTAAILILIAGIAYTMLLISWQWLLRYNAISANHKLCLFLEPYHAPYNNEHRYWTCLLLLVRVTLYVNSAMNISNNPDVNLLVIGIVVSSILLLKSILQVQIYKKRLLEILDSICYFNVILFCLVKLFVIMEAKIRNQAFIAYVSVFITFALLLAVIVFHVLTEVCCIEKVSCLTLRQKRNKCVNLGDCSAASNSQEHQILPTFSVIDAPAAHHREQPFGDELKEPLLTT